MTTVLRLVGGALLIAHGLVHLLYVADDVGEFTFDDSWLISDGSARTVGLPLMWATVVAFGLVSLAGRSNDAIVASIEAKVSGAVRSPST